MPNPDMHYGRRMTGNIRVRKGWYRTLVLQIEVENEGSLNTIDEGPTKWIDAQEHDLWRLDVMMEKKGKIPCLSLKNQ